MIETRLGKLEKVSFGLGGYQEACIGFSATISGQGWGVSTNTSAWDVNKIKHTEHCKWTEADRDAEYIKLVKYVSGLLNAAKVDTVDQLNGIAVEATFDDNTLSECRILTEVL